MHCLWMVWTIGYLDLYIDLPLDHMASQLNTQGL